MAVVLIYRVHMNAKHGTDTNVLSLPLVHYGTLRYITVRPVVYFFSFMFFTFLFTFFVASR